MKLPQDCILLRAFFGESDTFKGKPLYEQVVFKAKELGLAGTTVTRGIIGFGADSKIHSIKLLDISEDLPIIVEIVDTEENIAKILPFLDETIKEGLVTQEKVKVIKYTHS